LDAKTVSEPANNRLDREEIVRPNVCSDASWPGRDPDSFDLDFVIRKHGFRHDNSRPWRDPDRGAKRALRNGVEVDTWELGTDN